MQWFLILSIPVISGIITVIALNKCRKPKEISLDTPNFSVIKYVERMENLAVKLSEERENAKQRITLWWGMDGLRLNDDGTTEWIKRARITENAYPYKESVNQGCSKFSALPRETFYEVVKSSGIIYKPRRYQIWDKKSEIHTLTGDFSPEEWMEQHPQIARQGAVPVISAGAFNGTFVGELGAMKRHYERMGAEFESGLSDEQLLCEIEKREYDKMQEETETQKFEAKIRSLEMRLQMQQAKV